MTTIYHNSTLTATRPTHAWVSGFEVIFFFFECPYVIKTSLEWFTDMGHGWMYA